MLRQFELVERVKSYDPNADEDGLNRAYVFAVKMHGSQKRESGDPYFSHPVEVAGILTEYKLDYATIITALLHDTVEDTAASYADIEKLFGSEVAFLVEGVTKLSKIQTQAESEHTKQAENFRKLVLAMSEDIRVLLIKLADRLHNMRTLHFCKKEEKRKRIARETLDIYAPLAERLGMNKMKDELEDLAFSQLHPEAWQSIQSRLSFLRQRGGDLTERIVEQLKKDVAELGPDVEVYGREKRPYSIWRKMQNQNIAFEQICDIMAFRIVVPTVADCYHALGIVHTKYPMIPGRYKDYISTPKSNGYQSLHTGVIGPFKQRIEVQIRTYEMHEVAELGVAAHWEYKQGANVDGKKFRWMRELLDLLRDSSNSDEFLENTKMSMYEDQLFCFTPKGDLFNLPKNATAIDFAYAVHSNIGDHCVGVKINGEIKPVRTVLQNGDQVEVLTSKTQTPSPEWERFVVTAKAKAAIRRFLRNQKRIQFVELGRSLIQGQYKENKVPFNEKEVESVVKDFKQASLDDLYVMIGEGIVLSHDVFYKIYPEHRSTLQKVVDIFKRRSVSHLPKEDKKSLIRGLEAGIALHYSRCCHPVPGDKIVGIVTTGKGIAIHRSDCVMLKKYKNDPERWLDIDWNDSVVSDSMFPVRLLVTVADKPNALATLSTTISKLGSNISHLYTTGKSAGFMELAVDVDVKNVEHLDNIINALKDLPVIVSVKKEK